MGGPVKLKTPKGVRQIQVDDWYGVRDQLNEIGKYVAERATEFDYDRFKSVNTANEAIMDVVRTYRKAAHDLLVLARDVAWIGELAPTSAMDLMVMRQGDKREVAFRFSRLAEECEDYYVLRIKRFLNEGKDAFGVFYDMLGDITAFEKEVASLKTEMDFHAAPYAEVPRL